MMSQGSRSKMHNLLPVLECKDWLPGFTELSVSPLEGLPKRSETVKLYPILYHQTINLDKFASYSTDHLSAIYSTELGAIPASGLKKTKPRNRVALNTEHPLNIREYGWITRQDNTVSPIP
jgi:hypothetical protein